MSSRTDPQTGEAYAGSQRQTQLWVNQRADELNSELVVEFPELAGRAVRWTSPLAVDGYREYQDTAFLNAVGLGGLASALAGFWPRGGPVWDALAIVETPTTDGTPSRPGVILAEGKSYPGELRSRGCQASPTSRARIEAALATTQQTLGVTDRTPADWCGPLYQTANRLAHLTWLRSLGIRAWLVHLLFVNDPHSPTTAAAWEQAISDASDELGLPTRIAHAGHVLLRAD